MVFGFPLHWTGKNKLFKPAGHHTIMRSISNRNILDEFCISFCKVVQKYVKYIVVSGFVAISSGRVRGTEDIDMIVERMQFERYVLMHHALLKAGFCAVQSANEKTLFTDYLASGLSVRYTHKDNPLPEMELKFAKDPLDEYQLATRTKLQLTGLPIWFSNINVNIAFKEYYLKSDKDLEDAMHLRQVYPELVDENEIKNVATLIKRHRL
jgi:hypothetical protein